jgi:hypothetical protein
MVPGRRLSSICLNLIYLRINGRFFADAIKAKINGQLFLYIDDDIEFLATHYAAMIEGKSLASGWNAEVIVDSEDTEYEPINLQSVKNRQV